VRASFLGERLLEAAPLGDVDRVGHQHAPPFGIASDRRGDEVPDPLLAARRRDLALAVVDALLEVEQPGDDRVHRLGALAVGVPRPRREGAQLGGVEAADPGPGGVDEDDLAVFGEDHRRDRHVGDDTLQARLRLADLALGGLSLGDVAKDEDASVHLPLRVADRRRAVVDRRFRAVAPDQQGVIRQPDDHAVAQRTGRGVLDRLARRFVDDPKDSLQRLPLRFLGTPAGERLGDPVEVADTAVEVGRDDGVTDALERDAQALALRRDQRFGSVAGAQVTRRARSKDRSSAASAASAASTSLNSAAR
jgi:hypothetical protein